MQRHYNTVPHVHAGTLLSVRLTAGHRGSQKGVSYLQVDGEPWKQAIPTKDGEHFTVGSGPYRSYATALSACHMCT